MASETSATPRRQALDALRIDRNDEVPSPLAARHMNRWRLAWMLLAFVIIGALGVGIASYWLRMALNTAPVQAAVVRQAPRAAQRTSVLDASGYVVARRMATVSSKVTGKIVEIMVQEGMKVEKGQLLARLDDSLNIGSLQVSASELAVKKRVLDETRVRIEEAETRFRRDRELHSVGYISHAALDRLRSEVDALKAQLSRQREEVFLAGRMLALRERERDELLIRAPFSGVAITKDAQVGEMVSPMSAGGSFTRTGISTIVDMKSLEIEVDVNESYINRVLPGQVAQARLDAYPEWAMPCTVITIVPAADRQKATVRVRIAFRELDPRILPGMAVKVSFQEEKSS